MFELLVNLCGCSMEEDGDSNMCIDTDSDAAEKKDGSKCKVKWTQEEVNEKKTLTLMCIFRHSREYIIWNYTL